MLQKKTIAPASSSSAGLGAKMRSELISGYDVTMLLKCNTFPLKDPLNHAQKTSSHIFEGLTSESLIVSRCKGPPAKTV